MTKPVAGGDRFKIVAAWANEPPKRKTRWDKRQPDEEDSEGSSSSGSSDDEEGSSSGSEENEKSDKSDEDEKGDDEVKKEKEKEKESSEISSASKKRKETDEISDRPFKRPRINSAPSSLTQSCQLSNDDLSMAPESRIQCRDCDFTADTSSKMVRHYRIAHSERDLEEVHAFAELRSVRVLCPVPECDFETNSSNALHSHLFNRHELRSRYDQRLSYPEAFVFVHGSNVAAVEAKKAARLPHPHSNPNPEASDDSSSTKRSLKRSASEGPSSTEAPPTKKAKTDGRQVMDTYVGRPGDGHRYKLVNPEKDQLLETKSKEDQQWYSSKIISLNPPHVNIRFEGFPYSFLAMISHDPFRFP